ncbi:MAG: adenylosuccinate lyase [Flavobacteriales bacterium]|nr:adenylosuccinate lyase [Flavobacteriales bacterium]
MNIDILSSISPVDGRYRKVTDDLGIYFSEAALIRYRVLVEVEYFIALVNVPLPQLESFDKSLFDKLRAIYQNFTLENAKTVKDIEAITNHDVKAVEYFLKEEFDKLGLEEFKEFIHFGLTSQDINNTAIPLSLKEGIEQVMDPMLNSVVELLQNLSNDWKDVSMMAKTHGQPASPTRLGKEILVFIERIEAVVEQIKSIPYSAKFGGATGNLNAHHVSYPSIDWISFSNYFVADLGLKRSKTTTQIEHYDNLAALFDGFKRLNNIFIDLDRDIWMYISMNYFKQKIVANEVGSSAMPHKVNPIDFENSEGNLGLANAILEHFAAKLPISRLQRDLTDSTVLRNVGVPLAHMLISMKSLTKGLNKLILNQDEINRDLDNNWAVAAEGIQTVLKREGYPKPYEALKELTRKNSHVNQESLGVFIDGLNITDALKTELKLITPHSYTGI